MARSFPATNIQLGLLLHAGVVMTALKLSASVEHLRSRHETGLLSRQVGGEVLTKLRGINVGETVRCLLYRVRFAEITWETLSVVSLIFSSIWHVGRDVD